MRSIPSSLKKKLAKEIKASSTNAEPHVKIISTQMAINTLLSEIIHEDIEPDFGDVTIRQLPGETEASLSYAVCIDEGIAKIYKRYFPADEDHAWEYVWTYGAADDVAIEYQGTWKMNDDGQWCYLETEQYPYIFILRSGNLYVQRWQDTSTRLLLAQGVSQIAACKGWQNSVDPALDQGLVIGYLRDGEVFYRAYCCISEGAYAWENEREVETLGNGNSSLAVFRTNDYRLGFLTEKSGRMYMTVSERTYAGMTVNPETAVLEESAVFYMYNVASSRYKNTDYSEVGTILPYFIYEPDDADEDIEVVSVDKINREDTFYAYGAVIHFNKGIEGNIVSSFISGIGISAGGSTYSVASASFDTEEKTLTLYFSQDIKRTLEITITLPTTRFLYYRRCDDQKWFLPSLTAVAESEIYEYRAFDADTADLSIEADYDYYSVSIHDYGTDNERALVSANAVFTLTAVGPTPV